MWPFKKEETKPTAQADPETARRAVVYLVKDGSPIRQFRKVYNAGDRFCVEVKPGTQGEYFMLIPGNGSGGVEDEPTLRWEAETPIANLSDAEPDASTESKGDAPASEP